MHTAEQVAALPSCAQPDQQAALGGYEQSCKDWLSISASVEECSDECASALQELGEECFAAYYRLRKEVAGSVLGDEALLAFANATFAACQAGRPLPEAAAAAMLEAELAAFPSCAAANLSAVLASGCDLNKAAGFMRSTTCPAQCGFYMQTLGMDCFMEVALGKAKGNGLPPGPDTERYTAEASALFDRCIVAAVEWLESHST
ncbi:adenylate cyclase [Chlorella sorokiniana]|uniref:Adenylate cyclase n=1 Tax=Chlorella sorokiniana TaxID=3076 RepID=A0A2P6TWM6_CHLSO|nr:adenylate cyclase [Chlorella sorokiniana]|eukprot:PRW58466.1 adenylate cyclase [Chlorella sorokiniana]